MYIERLFFDELRLVTNAMPVISLHIWLILLCFFFYIITGIKLLVFSLKTKTLVPAAKRQHTNLDMYCSRHTVYVLVVRKFLLFRIANKAATGIEKFCV